MRKDSPMMNHMDEMKQTDQQERAATVERIMIDKAARHGIPIHGSLELLPLCNMNCDMCYVRLTREEQQKKGRILSAQEWVAVAEQLRDAGTLFLLLTGGEPLLHPEFPEIYRNLKQMGFALTINTNGTLIDESIAELFGTLRPRRVNITLYGAGERTYRELCHYPGGFEKAMRGIRLLREQNVDVKAGISLTGTNQQEIVRMHELCEALDVPVRIDTYMMPAVRERASSAVMPKLLQARTDPKAAAGIRMAALEREMGAERYRIYSEQMLAQIQRREEELCSRAKVSDPDENTKEGSPEPMKCLAGSCSFSVNWQGELRPCAMMTEPSCTVSKHGFRKAWDTVRAEAGMIRTAARCSVCRLRPLCRTCAAAAVLETGAYDKVPDYLCAYAKESYRLLKQHRNDRKQEN